MRLYDKLRREKRFDDFVEKTKAVPIFIGDDIAQWYQNVSDEDWSVDDFPILAPPYQHCFFDYLLPLKLQDLSDDKIPFPESFGVYCSWRSPDKVMNSELGNTQMIRKYHDDVALYHPKWILEAVLRSL